MKILFHYTWLIIIFLFASCNNEDEIDITPAANDDMYSFIYKDERYTESLNDLKNHNFKNKIIENVYKSNNLVVYQKEMNTIYLFDNFEEANIFLNKINPQTKPVPLNGRESSSCYTYAAIKMCDGINYGNYSERVERGFNSNTQHPLYDDPYIEYTNFYNVRNDADEYINFDNKLSSFQLQCQGSSACHSLQVVFYEQPYHSLSGADILFVVPPGETLNVPDFGVYSYWNGSSWISWDNKASSLRAFLREL